MITNKQRDIIVEKFSLQANTTGGMRDKLIHDVRMLLSKFYPVLKNNIDRIIQTLK